MLVLSRAFLHEHFLFFPYLSYHTTRTLSTSRTSPSSLGRQVCAIKNHSGVETCRVAETRAQQLPQVMSPRNLRPSQGSKLILEIHINHMMYRKKLEKKITELLSPKKWRNLEKLRRLVRRILNYPRLPTSNRRCISTIPWKALQILISKMESYKRCWLHHPMPRKLRRKPAEREVSAQYTQADRKESLRSHSSEGQKASVKPDALFSS